METCWLRVRRRWASEEAVFRSRKPAPGLARLKWLWSAREEARQRWAAQAMAGVSWRASEARNIHEASDSESTADAAGRPRRNAQ